MKKTAFKPRTKPMPRTSIKRSTAPAGTAALAKVWKKKSRPRMTPIRKSAMGKECMLALPGVCNHDPATTVLCHSNRLADGKGMGLKAPDTKACYGCAACHDVLDGRRPRPDWLSIAQLDAIFAAAIVRTHIELRKQGLMK